MSSNIKRLFIASFVFLSAISLSIAGMGQISLTGEYSPAYNGVDDPWHVIPNLTIGFTAAGTMRVEGGSVVDSDGWSYLGYHAGSSGMATITGAGTTWDSFRQITVGFAGNGTMDVEDGAQVLSGGARIAEFGSSTSIATVTGPGTRWESRTGIDVGYGGHGRLNISNGGVVEQTGSTVFLGRNASSTGIVKVDGSGSQLNNNGTLFLGYIGNGDLTIENGGYVYNRNADVASGSGTTGVALVTGASSQWINDQNLSLGYNGNATLRVEDGGFVYTAWDAFIARNSGRTSSVTVKDAGSEWDIDRSLYVGGRQFQNGGTGILNIESGGLVSVADTLKIWSGGTVNVMGGTLDVGTLQQDGILNVTGGEIAVDVLTGDFVLDGGTLAPGDSPGLTTIQGDFQFDSGTVEIEIGGLLRGTEFDAIDVTGSAILNGLIDVNLISGFSPLLGETFQVLNASSLSGTPTFDFSDATLASGLAWDTSNFISSGSITVGMAVIPEPSSFGIVVVVGLGLGLRRRRSS